MANLTAMVMLVFFGTLIIAMSIPRTRSYHADLCKINYQLSRIADNLAAVAREQRKNREAMEQLMREDGQNEDDICGADH